MHVVLWQEARCTCAEDFAGAAEDFVAGGTGAALGICHEGIDELDREGIAEELGGLRAGFLGIAFLGLLAEASAVVAESSLNFLTASLASLASFACRLAHSSG